LPHAFTWRVWAPLAALTDVLIEVPLMMVVLGLLSNE
jgi:hypothetical protein